MDEVQNKEAVLVSHKPLSKPHGYRGKAKYFMACVRDGRLAGQHKDEHKNCQAEEIVVVPVTFKILRHLLMGQNSVGRGLYCVWS
jgi:uncharacterized protein YcbK (DUF882 family)